MAVMSDERLYFCLSLAAAGLLMLVVAAGLAFSMPGAEAPTTNRPATVTGEGAADGTDAPRPPPSRVPIWLPALLGVALLGSAFVVLLRGSVSPGYAGPRGDRTCRRCGQRLDSAAALDCPNCAAPTRCPQCGTDLTRGEVDVCPTCGAPWGCRYCGYSLKGLASNPCPSCHAPTLCHRCGAELNHNITGRCAGCGARIAGWREWR